MTLVEFGSINEKHSALGSIGGEEDAWFACAVGVAGGLEKISSKSNESY